LTATAVFGPAPLQAQDTLPELHGHIAYVGSDNNVYVFNPHTGADTALTADANANRRYEWPTWSTDGRLAYFATTQAASGDVTVSAAVALLDAEQPVTEVVYEGQGEVFNYASWSPGDCADGDACRDLAILLSGADTGMFVELVRVVGATAANSQAIPGGPPFYYSWSPDGSRMLWHRRVESDYQFDVYSARTNEIETTLPYTPGRMNTPDWSPVDDRLLAAVQGRTRAQSNLAVVADNTMMVLAEDLSGLVSFAWSPDGTKVAYATADRRGHGPLYVVDAATGDVVSRSPGTGIIAFFWSPDSEKIAYITLATPPGSFNASSGVLAAAAQPDVDLAWSVLNVAAGTADRYGGFSPTEAMSYLLSYFDQFAQSHSIWSPDSRHLLYSEIGRSGPVLSVLDTSRPDSVPFSIKEGVIGIWSYN
jgi:TolB protein